MTLTSLVTALALFALGCSTGPETATRELVDFPAPSLLASVDDVVIGFAVQSEERAFSEALIAGANATAEAAGVTLKIANAEGSAARQSDRIDELLDAGVDAIILSPVDSTLATDLADRVLAAGVPLLAVSNQIGSVKDYGAQYVYPGTVGLVANDDLQMGRIAAGFVQEPVGANIAVLQGNPSAANSNLRLAGFTSALDALGVTYEIVAQLTGHWEQQAAEPACEAFANMERVDLVFSMSDEMTAACVKTLHDLDRRDIQFISIGGSRQGLTMLTIDFVLGTVCQSPKTMGALAVSTMLKAFSTGDFNQGLRIGLADEVTRATMDDCRVGW